MAVVFAQITSSGIALAQSPQNSQGESTALEEVTVTAQRREQSLQDVPISVTAVTPDDLQNRAVYSTQDLQMIAPELKLLNNLTTPTNLSLSFRGSTQGDASVPIAESPIGLYVDDIFVARMNGNNVQFPDIDNIDFLRGPQGTLYGRNTLQGAVTFNSRTPGDTPWIDVSGGLGNFEQYRANFSVGQPLGGGWAASVAGMYDYKKGEYFNIGTDTPWDREENDGTRLKIHYYGSSVFEFTGFTSLVHSESQALPLVPATVPNDPGQNFQFMSNQLVPTYGYYTLNAPSTNYGVDAINNLPTAGVVQTITGLTEAWKFSGLTFKSITGFVTTRDNFTTAFSGVTPVGTGPVGAGSGIGGAKMNDKEITQELQLLGKVLDDRLDFIAGLYYFRETAGQTWGWYGFGLGPISNSLFSLATDSYSAYGQATYDVTDALSFTAGTRWTEDEKNAAVSITQLGITPGVVGTAFTAPIHDDLAFVAVTPKFGIDYKLPSGGFVDTALLYANAARGFKSGGINGVNVTSLEAAETPYKSETNWTYEAGVKTDMLDHKLRVNADYFIADTTNYVLTEAIIVPGTNVTDFAQGNAGDVRVQGLEMEISAVPLQGLTLFLNPVFETGKYTALNPTSSAAIAAAPHSAAANTCDSPLPPNVNGYCITNPVPLQVPWFSLTTGFDYKRGIPFGSLPDAQFIAGADWFKTASYALSATNDYIQSPYDRLNGYVGVAVSKELQFRLEAKNIQDRVTIATGGRGQGGFLTLPPREVQLMFYYKQR